MNKNNIIMAAAAAILFVGAAGVAVAGAQGSPHDGDSDNNNRVQHVTIEINKIATTVNTSRNNPNKNSDANANVNVNQAKNSNASLNTNANQNGNSNSNGNANNNTNTNANNSTAAASALSGASASSSSEGGGGGSSEVTVDGDEAPASSAAPIFLSVGDDTCMGSGGLGVQSANIGLSLGSTWTDSNCVMLRNARELKNQGHDKAAKARLCMNEDNALAFELAGEPCPRALPSTQAALERIREWNPDYQRVAAQPVQLAALDGAASVAGRPAADGQDVALLAVPDSHEESEWLSSGFGSLASMVRVVFEGLASGISENTIMTTTSMDGIE